MWKAQVIVIKKVEILYFISTLIKDIFFDLKCCVSIGFNWWWNQLQTAVFIKLRDKRDADRSALRKALLAIQLNLRNCVILLPLLSTPFSPLCK